MTSDSRRVARLTAAERVLYDEWRAAVAAATWDCVHGVTAGSLARPRPLYGPRCALCRAAGFTRWRRMDQLGRVPESYL